MTDPSPPIITLELLEQSPEAMLRQFWSPAAEASLKARQAAKEINYFNKHKHRMRYASGIHPFLTFSRL